MKRLTHDYLDAHMVDKYHMGIFIQWFRNLLAKIFGKKITTLTGVIGAVVVFATNLLGKSDAPVVVTPPVIVLPLPDPEPQPPVEGLPDVPVDHPWTPDPAPSDPDPVDPPEDTTPVVIPPVDEPELPVEPSEPDDEFDSILYAAV